MERPNAKRMSVTLGLVAVLSACGGGSAAVSQGTTATDEELAGRWRPADPKQGGGEPAFVEFESNRLSGYDGCNVFSSTWNLQGDQLTVGAIEATEQGCDPSIECDLPRLLASDPQVTFAGDRLVLESDGETFELRR